MKHLKINILALLLLFFGSCESYLDLAPELEISEDDAYENYQTIQGYLDNCYRALTDHSKYQNQNKDTYGHIEAISDLAGITNPYTKSHSILTKGDWLNKGDHIEVGWKANDKLGTNKCNVIANSFYALRISNKLIARLPSTTTITDEERELLLGQAYFFRAWYFFEVIRRWGGMPLMNEVFFSDSEQELTRKSYQECSQQIINDLDIAIENLPHRWDETNLGRVNIVAAMSVKGMVALYAASPLMQNEIGSSRNEKLAYSEVWAAKAAKYTSECVKYVDQEMPEKQLKDYSGTLSQEQEDEMRSNYRGVFYHAPSFVSNQSLWYINSLGADRNIDMKIHYKCLGITGGTGSWAYGHTYASQNLAQMYENRDGSIADITSSSYLDDRDPRFYNNIYHPGQLIREDPAIYLASWVGGRDNENVQGYSRTVPSSYLVAKYMWPESIGTTNIQSDLYFYNCIYIRMAQVWLDMAEAMNEAYGPNSDPEGFGYTAVDAINKVRDRVNMPRISSSVSKDDLTARIRNERTVELCFENHRWFDIRRWVIAEDLFSDTNPVKGLRAEKIDPTSGTTEIPGDTEFAYSEIGITTEIRVFDNKHYWYPLAYDHMNQLSSLVQNPGW